MSIPLDHAGSSRAHRAARGVLWWKRPLDLLLLLFLLPAILVCFAGIAIMIKLVSRGPVFFTQERIGFRGRKFRLYKFRTMHPQADSQVHAAYVASLVQSNRPMNKLDGAGDKRVIPFGNGLRASGLDELPQLINVLKGEMSVVGPRPCTTYEYEMYEDWQKERFTALPGLTGLWQVSGKNRTTFKQMIELDIQYARSASIGFDLEIVARTFPTLLGQIAERLGRRVSLPVDKTQPRNVEPVSNKTFL
jgi:exopolysaccharide production protein ExoY